MTKAQTNVCKCADSPEPLLAQMAPESQFEPAHDILVPIGLSSTGMLKDIYIYIYIYHDLSGESAHLQVSTEPSSQYQNLLCWLNC